MSTTETVLEDIIAQPLAINGGPKVVGDGDVDDSLFAWPIITEDDEQAVLEVLRAGTMSELSIAIDFEKEWAAFNGTDYALSYPNGTMALLVAMQAVGLGRGDVMICPDTTYWASVMQIFSLGATPVFADVDPVTLCLDPADIEHRITAQTKAVMCVHYSGHPCDMDAINDIARRHKLKVIEDVSHAHGAMYKGKMCGNLGDVGAMSMMTAKGFAIGEAGMLVTNQRSIYERAIAFSHYKRIRDEVTDPDLLADTIDPVFNYPIPLGGIKGRLNQMCAAMGRVQLKTFPKRIDIIQRSYHQLWDLLEGVPGIAPHLPPKNSGLTMGGWYNAMSHYRPEELGGLPVDRLVEALRAEGLRVRNGINAPLHGHPAFNRADVYHDAKPTRIALVENDLRQADEAFPVSTVLRQRTFCLPRLAREELMENYIPRVAIAIRKVTSQADKLR